MVVFGGRAVEELGGGVGCDSVNCVPGKLVRGRG